MNELISPKLKKDDFDIIEDVLLNGEKRYFIGNKKEDRYIAVNRERKEIIETVNEYLNGRNSLEYIEDIIINKYKKRINIQEVLSTYSNIGLIEGVESKPVYNELELMGISIFKKNFSSLNETFAKGCDVVYYIGKVFGYFALFIALPIILINFKTIYSTPLKSVLSYNNSYIIAGIIMYGISLLSLLIHEFAHICTTAHNRLQIKKISIALYMGITPIYYSTCRGMYTVDIKKRLAMIGSGLYANLMLATVGFFFVALKVFPPSAEELIYKVIIVNTGMIISNITPFKLSDGYFIFSNVFGVNNFRLNMLKNIFRNPFKVPKTFKELMNTIYLLIFVGLTALGIFYTVQWAEKVYNEISISILKVLFLMGIGGYSILIGINMKKKYKRKFGDKNGKFNS